MHPWTIGMCLVGFAATVGLVTWTTSWKKLKRFHGMLLLPNVAWTIFAAATVTMADKSTVFDQGMALGLLGMLGLVGYLSPKPEDESWATTVHVLLGVVILVWYGVLAYNYSRLPPVF